MLYFYGLTFLSLIWLRNGGGIASLEPILDPAFSFHVFIQSGNSFFSCRDPRNPTGHVTWQGQTPVPNTRGSHKGTCGHLLLAWPWSELLQGAGLASWWRRKQGKSVGEQCVRVKPSTGDEVKPPCWPHPFLPEKRERQMKSKWEVV